MSTPATATEIPVGHTFEIDFGLLKPRVTFLSTTHLRFEILEGEYAGLTETVEYEVVPLRPGLFVVSWQEKSKTTVVHVEDFAEGVVHTHITFPDDSFVRLSGPIS
jgi:hypothetical protein